VKETIEVEMVGEIELSERQIEVIAKIFMEELKMTDDNKTKEGKDGIDENLRFG